MNLWQLLTNIMPFVLPYRWLIAITLVLTLIGSLMAQVNAVVLDRAVDAINALIQQPGGFVWAEAVRILTIITIILLGKEVIGALVTFFQRYYGERMRILVSRDLSLRVVDRILSFRMAFFTSEGNETGKLQSRIDRGIMSLSNTVNNFFIEILPLFTSAVLALVLMFAANVYVGLVALCIVPLYFWVTYIQASRMKGGRRGIFGGHQAVSQGILNIIESITVIKSFNREKIEADRQAGIQRTMTDLQLNTRKQAYLFNGLKSFLEQIGTVLIIILTAYLVLIDYPGMSIGKIMYHVMLFANVSAPIRQLHRIYDDMNDALIYAEGFFGILQADEEVETTGQHQPEKVTGNFELQDVNFTYSNGTKALHDVSMRIDSMSLRRVLSVWMVCPCMSGIPNGCVRTSAWCSRKITFLTVPSRKISNTATLRPPTTMWCALPNKPISTIRLCNCLMVSRPQPCNSVAVSSSASPSPVCSSRTRPSSSLMSRRQVSMPSPPNRSRRASMPSNRDAQSSLSPITSGRSSMPIRSMCSSRDASYSRGRLRRCIVRADFTKTSSMPAPAV